jgi:predicted nucleic acid-binding protein
MIFVDTDVLVDVLRAKPPAVQWMRTHGDVVVASGYSGFELIDGTQNSSDLQRTRQLLSHVRLQWLTPSECDVALRSFEQVHLANAIGVTDILIAHTALSLGEPLHTFNVKHYAAVPGLQTVQPYTR